MLRTQRPTHWQSETPWETLPTHLHHSQHQDWLLTARLAPTNSLPGQMSCMVLCHINGCAFAFKKKGEKSFKPEKKERENVFLQEEEVKVMQQRRALMALETLVPFFPSTELHGLTSQNCCSALVSSAKQAARSVRNARRCLLL